jgi:hypothetical protein
MTKDPPQLRVRPVMFGKKINPTENDVEPVAGEMYIVSWISDGAPLSHGYPQQQDALQEVGRLFDK